MKIKRVRKNRRIGVLVLCGCVWLAGCGLQKEETTVEPSEEGKVAQETEDVRDDGAVQLPEMPDPEEAAAEAIVPPEKDEVIFVQADAHGVPEKIEVSGTLSGFRGESGKYLSDISGLSDLKNATGEEEFCVSEDGTVYWQNLGEDVRYEGISEEDLPVDVNVTYFLDGEEAELSAMKGKSGEIRIRFDYEIRETAKVEVRGEEQEMTVPFLALSLVVLPEETFSDVQVSHGGTVMLGGQKAVAGYALPGLKQNLHLGEHEDTEDMDLPDYVEITAETENFALEFTATILKPGLFRKMDEEKLDDLEDRIGEGEELEDAVKELEKAAGELTDGTSEMSDYLQQYTDGVNQMAEAVGTIRREMDAYDLSALGQVAEQLQLAGMEDAAVQIIQLQSGMQGLQSGLAQLEEGAAALPESGKSLRDGMEELADGTASFRDGITEFREEGIEELTGFFRDELGDLIARVRGIHAADLQYSGYTPSQKGQEVSTSFLIETRGT